MGDTLLEPNDVEEGMTVRLSWSKRGTGPGDDAEGEVTRVWRPDDDVREFTVQPDDDSVLNVYTEYRKPPVERVEESDDPDAETIGRLDEIRLASR